MHGVRKTRSPYYSSSSSCRMLGCPLIIIINCPLVIRLSYTVQQSVTSRPLINADTHTFLNGHSAYGGLGRQL